MKSLKLLYALIFILLLAVPASAQVGLQFTLAGETCATLFTSPTQGRSLCLSNDDNRIAVYDGAAWVFTTLPESGILGAAQGGFGIDTSGSTGVASVSAGTWSVAATLANSLGGTGRDTSSDTGTPHLSSGTWSIGDIEPEPSTVAALGSAALPRRVKVLTDGDAAGLLVVNDGTSWRTLDWYKNAVAYVCAPPYNASQGATASANATAIQSAFDDADTQATAGGTVQRATVHFCGLVYNVDTEITYNGSGTSLLLGIEGGGAGGATAAGGMGVDSGWDGSTNLLDIDCGGAACNNISIHNLFLKGSDGVETITAALYCNACVQFYFSNIYVFNIDKYAIQFGASTGNGTIVGIQSTEGSGCAQADGAIIFAGSGMSHVNISNGWHESSCTTSTLSAMYWGSKFTGTVKSWELHGSSIGYLVRHAGTGGAGCGRICVFEDIEGEDVREYGVDYVPLSDQSDTDGRLVLRNLGIEADTSGNRTACIRVANASYTQIIGNYCTGAWGDGIRAGETGNFISGNYVQGAGDALTLWNAANSVWVDNIVRDATTTGIAESGSTAANTIIENTVFIGDLPTNPIETANLGNTVMIKLTDKPQILTCADTADGSARSVTTEPYAARIGLDNDDTSGGCIYIPPNTGDVIAGWQIAVFQESTVSAQPTKVSVDGGTNCRTLEAGEIQIYELQSPAGTNAWTYLRGDDGGSAAC